MNADDKQTPLDHLVAAYEKMLERVHHTLEQTEHRVPNLRQNLEQAREKAVEMGELTREEAEKVASYIERDLHDAASFIVETGQQVRDWWRFDLGRMQVGMLEWFSRMADQTSLQLQEMAEQLRQAQIYRTGEVTGPGTLVCAACGREMHFQKPGHIPPCPHCHGTQYGRAEDDDQDLDIEADPAAGEVKEPDPAAKA